jgi:transposase
MVVADGQGIPLGSTLASASPAEVNLATQTLEQIKVTRNGPGRPKKRPKRLIGDKAYDSDPFCKELKQRGIDFIAPHRKNRTKPKIQDGRKLRRYRKRWKVERTIAWIANFRRLTTRYEKLITVYRAFFHIACLLITLRALCP